MSRNFPPGNIKETVAHWKVTRVDSSLSCNPRHSIHVTAEEPPMTTTTARGAAPARKAPGTGTGNAAPRRRRRPRSDLRVALLFIAPAMIGFVAFYLVPSIRGVYLSFTEYSILGDPTWIGTKNYTAIFADDLFWNAMAVTVQYVGTEHRLPDRHRPRTGPADAPRRQVHAHPRRPAAALPGGQRDRRAAVVLDARLPDSASSTSSSTGWACRASPSSAASNGPSPPSPASTSGATWATPPC